MAVLDRWTQLAPTVLLADNAVFYNGRAHDSIKKVKDIVAGLPTLKHVVVLRKFPEVPVEIDTFNVPGGKAWVDKGFLESARDPARKMRYEQLDADHPVYVLFSSGTTGSEYIYEEENCGSHG